MIKRISLVWKLPELSRSAFREIWLGEHAEVAKRLPKLREYIVDFVDEAPDGAPDAVTTLRFDTRSDLDAAFSDPHLSADLLRTRDQFAASVQIMLVDECTVYGGKGAIR
jgi:uncharacterized protein (TIGR02118 family)